MARGHRIILLLLSIAAVSDAYCPINGTQHGMCAFSFHCKGNIRGVRLPEECQGSTNYPVTVELTLTDVIERFDYHIDVNFLASVTTLRISAKWPLTNLSILQHTPSLQNLYLIGDQIKVITGTPFLYLNRLEILDLSWNQLENIEDLFQFESETNSLKKLSLNHNAIDEIPGDAFGELISLIELDLSFNLITDLDEEPFVNLTSLEVLRLNNNKIKDLNGAVNNLHNLKHLYLRGNQIENIDVKSLKIIIHLETFDVSWNQLQEIKPIMFSRHWKHFGDHSICKIILSENYIVTVPNATAKEISSRFARHLNYGNTVDILTELDLSKNEITDIQYSAFQSLVRLISLDLSKNKLVNFVVNTDDLTHVKFLNLSGNYITNLYLESFTRMSNLQNLDLSYNQLDYIPDRTFTDNHDLKHVNMTFNQLAKLDNLNIYMFHAEGGKLDLSNNGLSKLNIPIGEGLRLKMLILHSNNITNLSLINLRYQSDLRDLDLSRNYISALNEISLHLPPGLESLDLSYNLIQEIGSSTFHHLGHLKTLRLARNKLRSIKYGIFQGLTALQNLDLSFNKLDYLDSMLMMDLKSLTFLSIRYNGMIYLDYKGWLNHKINLKVFIEGNNFTCEWLGSALSDFNNGYSKMRPMVLMPTKSGPSLQGIPCLQKSKEIAEYVKLNDKGVSAEEKMLATSQKILEAVLDQTSLLKKFIWRAILDNSENIKA